MSKPITNKIHHKASGWSHHGKRSGRLGIAIRINKEWIRASARKKRLRMLDMYNTVAELFATARKRK